MLAGAASGQSDCQGKVGGYAYDLTQLAQKFDYPPIDGAVDLQTQDNSGQTYFYRVCGVVDPTFCQTRDDPTPAVCQKDLRIPARFHDLGSQKTATFSSLPNRPDNAGFTLSYFGGQEDRAAKIYFVWCVTPVCSYHFVASFISSLLQRPEHGPWRVLLHHRRPHQGL
jgi:hypothetical protein